MRITAARRVVYGAAAIAAAVVGTVIAVAWAAPVQPVLAEGGQHGCVLRSALYSGGPACWGRNNRGQLGDGTTTNRPAPAAVDTSGVLSGLTLTRIVAGGRHTCAMSSAGGAFCWGDNGSGQVGDGTTTNRSTPVAVDTSGALNGVTLTDITTGNFFTCALSTTGRAYCWGDNYYGHLGDGTTSTRSAPVAVDASGALNGVTLTKIVAGNGYSVCALSSLGRLYCWGANYNAQLGDGSTTNRHTPVAVDTGGALNGLTLTGVTLGGEYHTCALASTGAAYCWGENSAGQLGDGTTAPATTAVPVSAGLTFTQLTAGNDHTCGLTATHLVYCWGGNATGELGDGTTTDHSAPTAIDSSGVLSGRTITQVVSYGSTTCAVTRLRGVFCWGGNNYGQLGDGTTTMRTSPVEVIAEDVLTLPDAPTSLTGTPGDGQLTVQFLPPADNGTGPVTSYDYSTDGGTTWQSLTTTDVADGYRSGTITGLTNAVTYQVSVRARNSNGPGDGIIPVPMTPAAPPPVTPPTPVNRLPGAPMSLTATPGNGRATVTFLPPADNGSGPVTGYDYSTDAGATWHPLTTTTGSGSLRTGAITGLTNGSSYDVAVRARNATGPGPAATAVSVTLLGAPRRPQSVTATAGTSSITVSWTASTSGGAAVTGYTAIADPGPATCTTTGATSCVLGATGGTNYTIIVVAHSDNGDSPPSTASDAVTPAAPTPPAAPPTTDLTLTTDKGDISTAAPGQQITVIGTGFAAYSTVTVTVYSAPTALGTVVTDATGAFSLPVTVPAGLTSGQHTVVAQGAAPDGTARSMNLAVSVRSAHIGNGGNGGLPVTGSPASRIAAAGLLVLLLGSGLLRLNRRRRDA